MARVSFTLRRSTQISNVSDGSYLRYDDDVHGSRPDDDSVLRAGGILLAPDTGPSGFLDADNVNYGEVLLNWNIPNIVDFSNNASQSASTGVVPIGGVLLYSYDGVPTTLNSGRVLVDSPNRFEYQHLGVQQGRWVYYALFVKYKDFDADVEFYERVAIVGVLGVRKYDSTELLWRRIPQYYRDLDQAQAAPYTFDCGDDMECRGPLYKFLSIIGYEMDRIRTITEHFIVSKDAYFAAPRTVDLIAKQEGLVLRSSDLGDQRLRRLLNNTGILSRQKGTVASIRGYLNALTGADFTIFENGDVRIHSQRVNYVPSPKTLGASPTYVWRPALVDEILTPRTFGYIANMPGGSVGYTDYTDQYDYSGGWGFAASATSAGASALTWVPEDGDPPQNDPAYLAGQIWRFNIPVRVRDGDRVVFSTHSAGNEKVLWARVVDSTSLLQLGAGSVRQLVDVTDADAEVSLETDADDQLDAYVAGTLDVPRNPDLINYIEIPVTFEDIENPGTWRDVYVEVFVDTRRGRWSGDQMLIERNYVGPYFDGDTIRGGWLTGVNYISDYRWQGTQNNSRSLYTEDYERTRQIVELLFSELLPITSFILDGSTVVPRYRIVEFGYVPGSLPEGLDTGS